MTAARVETASFEEFLDGELGDTLGDLGPADERPARSSEGDRGPRRNPRRGGGGGAAKRSLLKPPGSIRA